MRTNRLSDVVKSDYTELSKDSQGILRGGFGSIELPGSDGTNWVNNCECPPPNNCMCNGNNNCNCSTIKTKQGDPGLTQLPEIF